MRASWLRQAGIALCCMVVLIVSHPHGQALAAPNKKIVEIGVPIASKDIFVTDGAISMERNISSYKNSDQLIDRIYLFCVREHYGFLLWPEGRNARQWKLWQRKIEISPERARQDSSNSIERDFIGGS